jgi:hypothetical protein
MTLTPAQVRAAILRRLASDEPVRPWALAQAYNNLFCGDACAVNVIDGELVADEDDAAGILEESSQ